MQSTQSDIFYLLYYPNSSINKFKFFFFFKQDFRTYFFKKRRQWYTSNTIFTAITRLKYPRGKEKVWKVLIWCHGHLSNRRRRMCQMQLPVHNYRVTTAAVSKVLRVGHCNGSSQPEEKSLKDFRPKTRCILIIYNSTIIFLLFLLVPLRFAEDL